VKEWTKEEVALLSDDELLTIQGNLEEGQRLEVASASSEYATSLLDTIETILAERSEGSGA
jgi:hypothetical protein